MFYKITNQYVSKVSQKNKGRLSNYQGFPGGSEVKASACNVGDLGSIPRSGRSPGERNGNPFLSETATPIFLPVESHGQRSLAGYSPWGCRVRHD